MLKRGDERFPIKDRKIEPGTPASVGRRILDIRPVALPKLAYEPDKRPFVIAETKAASRAAVTRAESALKALKADPKEGDVRSARAERGGAERGKGKSRRRCWRH